MQKLAKGLFLAALGAGAMLGAAKAASVPPSQLAVDASKLGMVEQIQYVYGGRRYCWYNSGWHGPGWYWCGYAWHRGYGWGGVRGWNQWYWRGWGPRPYYHPHYYPYYRPHYYRRY